MLKDAQQAWIVKENLTGRSQVDIATELGHPNSTNVCTAVRRFCDKWSGVDVGHLRAYNDDRLEYARTALQRYRAQNGRVQKPSIIGDTDLIDIDPPPQVLAEINADAENYRTRRIIAWRRRAQAKHIRQTERNNRFTLAKKLIAKRESGMTYAKIGQLYNIKPGTVRFKIESYESHQTLAVFGRELAGQHKTGMSIAEIACQHGMRDEVVASYIKKVKAGEY